MAQSNIDSRINRLVGQIEGIRRMINSGRKTDDVVQQILAAKQALSRIGLIMLKEEIVNESSKKNTSEKRTKELLEKIFRV